MILRFFPEKGKEYASFHVYLPASEDGAYYTRYRFLFEENPVKPELIYENGVNDPANRCFYCIRTADLIKREGEGFAKVGKVVPKAPDECAPIDIANRNKSCGFVL